MDKAAFEKYLKDRYEDQVNWYDRKATKSKKLYSFFQTIVIVLAALTPILVALGGDWERLIAIVISATVAISAALLKTFKYQENWINYRTTCETLRKEIEFYRAGIGDYGNSKDPDALFVERVEAVISRENTLWLSAQKSKGEEKENRSS